MKQKTATQIALDAWQATGHPEGNLVEARKILDDSPLPSWFPGVEWYVEEVAVGTLPGHIYWKGTRTFIGTIRAVRVMEKAVVTQLHAPLSLVLVVRVDGRRSEVWDAEGRVSYRDLEQLGHRLARMEEEMS